MQTRRPAPGNRGTSPWLRRAPPPPPRIRQAGRGRARSRAAAGGDRAGKLDPRYPARRRLPTDRTASRAPATRTSGARRNCRRSTGADGRPTRSRPLRPASGSGCGFARGSRRSAPFRSGAARAAPAIGPTRESPGGGRSAARRFVEVTTPNIRSVVPTRRPTGAALALEIVERCEPAVAGAAHPRACRRCCARPAVPCSCPARRRVSAREQHRRPRKTAPSPKPRPPDDARGRSRTTTPAHRRHRSPVRAGRRQAACTSSGGASSATPRMRWWRLTFHREGEHHVVLAHSEVDASSTTPVDAQLRRRRSRPGVSWCPRRERRAVCG